MHKLTYKAANKKKAFQDLKFSGLRYTSPHSWVHPLLLLI